MPYRLLNPRLIKDRGLHCFVQIYAGNRGKSIIQEASQLGNGQIFEAAILKFKAKKDSFLFFTRDN